MPSNNDYSGCFLTISVICIGFAVFVAVGKGCQMVGQGLKENPWNVFGIAIIIGIVCYSIYKLIEK